MSIYIINLALIVGLAWPLCIHKPSKSKALCYLAVTFAALFFISAARQGIGNDYYSYIEMYTDAGQATLAELFQRPEEKGYLLLCKLLFTLGLSSKWMYCVMAVFCLAPVAWFIYKYSPNIWLSVWLYVTLTFFYGTMNFIRQNLAAVILLLGYALLQKKKLWADLCYVGVILLACSFHKTAIIMLPVLLVCRIPLGRVIGSIYGVLAVVLYLTSDYILDFVTQYVFTAYRGTSFLEYGFSYKFLIIPLLVLVLVLARKRQITERNENGTLMVNFMLYNALIWLFITKHFIIERFSLYVYIFVLLAVPMAVEAMRPDEAKRVECASLKGSLNDMKAKSAKGTKYKSLLGQYAKLRDEVLMQNVYYWCVIGALLLITLWYQVFGMYDGSNGFHGVFPYKSSIHFLNLLP